MDTYTENTDWDAIYGAFHDAGQIAARISDELPRPTESLIFCGFPQVASVLASERVLTFVDMSPAVVARSRKRYPGIQKVVEGDITRVLQSSSEKTVVICCRLSAFWHSANVVDQLIGALLSYPRDVVLIDFFDREAVREGDAIVYSAGPDSGKWEFRGFEKQCLRNLSIYMTSIRIKYNVGSTKLRYEARRAFYRRQEIKHWLASVSNVYKITLSDALIQDDPSFLVKLERSGSR